jgi:hypothetical protein
MARGGVNSLLKKFYKDNLNKFINITNSEMRVLLSLRGVCKPPIQITILVFALNRTSQKEKETTTTTSKLHKGATLARLTS